jgi:hypothetical protein
MNVPDSHTPDNMNWVDYCDALRDKQFFRRAQAQKPVPLSEPLPDLAKIASANKEVMRDVT